MKISVRPFALIRAVIQKNLRQTLSGNRLNADTIEKNTAQLVLHYRYPWFPKRKSYWNSNRANILFLIRRCFPFLNMHFYPPDIFFFFFATKMSLRKFLISLYFFYFQILCLFFTFCFKSLHPYTHFCSGFAQIFEWSRLNFSLNSLNFFSVTPLIFWVGTHCLHSLSHTHFQWLRSNFWVELTQFFQWLHSFFEWKRIVSTHFST